MNNNNKNNMNNIDLYRDIIILYCPPKVGSTSIVTSIRLCCSDKYMVFHTHDNSIFKFADNTSKDLTIDDLLKNTNIIGNNLIKNIRKIYLIDIYRSPIEQKISEFFEDISLYHFNNLEDNIINYDINKLIKRFNDIFIYIGNEDYYVSRYKLTKPTYFDFDKKYIIHTNNNVTYIKLRLIDVKYWGLILSDLLNTQIIIVPDYETKNKKIGLLYDTFNKKYKIPINYYNDICNCKLLKYYYNENERNEYLNKWKNKIGITYNGFTIEEYNFYKKISDENKFYNKVLLNHYKDEGCLCEDCKNKRAIIFKQMKNGNINVNQIIHNKNKEYQKYIYINIYNIDKINGFIINF